MTKRSACRNQLLNEVEGAEDAGTSRAFAGSASPTQRCTCQFRMLVARNRCFPPPIVNNRRARPRRSGLDSDSCKTFGDNAVSCSGPSRFVPISSIEAANSHCSLVPHKPPNPVCVRFLYDSPKISNRRDSGVEGVGFEPTSDFRRCRFSSAVLSVDAPCSPMLKSAV